MAARIVPNILLQQTARAVRSCQLDKFFLPCLLLSMALAGQRDWVTQAEPYEE